MDCLIYPGPDFGTEILVCDDCSQFIDLGFTFPFYGNDYTGIYVTSNGHLSFTDPAPYTFGTIQDFINGAPRIAPYWVDLYPAIAPTDGGVFYKQLSNPNRFVVTWVQVPYWFGPGFPPYNTFQVVLYETGRIGFAYNSLDNETLITINGYALVGVAEGNGGNSCIFKYDPPENYDPDETVDGPEGFLDGKQLFFDFVGSECTLTVRSCVSRGILPTIL